MKQILIYGCLIVFVMSCESRGAADTPVIAVNHNENAVVLDSAQKSNASILLDTARLENIHTIIKASGMVDVPPQSMVSVSFPLGGYLKSTSLLPGSPVSKGQVIAIMEDPGYIQLQQDYLTARAKMEYLATDMKRQKELSDADASSKKNYQLVLSDYNMQVVLLKSLGEKLQMVHVNPDNLDVNKISGTIPVYSPINGYVSKVNVNIGKYVNPTDVLFELVNPEDIHAAITVFEKDINAFRKGLKGRVSLVDQPDQWYDIETILVTRNVSDTRTGLVHCHFEKPMQNLLPGMFLNAVFNMDSKPATVVPDEAVVRYTGKEYIFTTADEKTFQLTEVSTGTTENGMIALEPGNADWRKTKIVVRGAYALLGKLKNKMED
jgi:cobalt-zinc-cadmium efflux system membrane fusion protein